MRRKFYPFVFILLIIPMLTFSQTDSIFSKEKKLVFNPSVHNLSIDGVTLYLINEVGANLDLDIIQTESKDICIGTRFSVEHYYLSNLTDRVEGSPYTDYNIYLRFTKSSEVMAASVFAGISDHTSSDRNRFPDLGSFRVGAELKYGKIIGLVLKGFTSLREHSGFIGIGLSICYDHIL